jgi:hypothetical protein
VSAPTEPTAGDRDQAGGAETVRNVCDTCEALYVPTAPHYAHACKRVPCRDRCPHPEMCEVAGCYLEAHP